MATVEIKLDAAAFAATEEQVRRAALKAMEAVKTDLVAAQTMPFDTGRMQSTLQANQFQDGEEIHTRLSTDTSYARRLYFHPEYNFQKANNPNAGAEWYGPYEDSGKKESLARDTFAAALKEAMPK